MIIVFDSRLRMALAATAALGWAALAPLQAADTVVDPATAFRMVPENLARDRSAKASSEQEGNPAKNAFDNNTNTRWCAANSDPNHWLQVDLGSAQELTGSRIVWEDPAAAYRYRIEGSTDGTAWHTLVDASQNSSPGVSTHAFQEKGTRFLRLTFLGNSSGSWGSLYELQVFGTNQVREAVVSPQAEKEKAIAKEVKVPAGFEYTVFATPPAVNYPVFVAAAPDGTVYVSSDKNGSLDRKPNRGSVVRLRDTDGDGKADEVKRFVADVDSPRGLVWDRDRLYLMHPPHLSVYIDRDGDGLADEEKVLVKNIAFGFKDRPADHTSNGVELGVDGWLYLAIGDFGFMEAEGTDGRKVQLRGGGLVRVRTDGTGLEVYARGTRNILEVAVDPLLNTFARDNTNDGDGWDIRMHHLHGLAHHGYPMLYKNFADEAIVPLADYGGGSGCGALYLDEPGFPEGYGNALYTADWGRQWVFQHHPKPKDSTFTVDQKEFVSVPHVTDLDVDASSRIYVASWKGATFTYVGEEVGYLLRVQPKGNKPEPLPNFSKASEGELIGLLESPSHRRRLESQRELLARGLKTSTVSALQALVERSSSPLPSRVAALFALKQGLGSNANPRLVAFAKDAALREFALRALTDHTSQLQGVPVNLVVTSLKDANPRVRREAAVSLARLGASAQAAALIPLLSDADDVITHTAIKALVALKGAAPSFAVVDQPAAPAAQRLGALRALQAMPQPDVVDGLIRRAGSEKDPLRRRGLLAALCRLYYLEGKWNGESWGTRPDTYGPYYVREAWSETPKIGTALKEALTGSSGQEASFLLGELTRHKIQLEDTIDTIIGMAEKDAAIVPAAVAQLSRSDTIPAHALPLLSKSATDAGSDATLRSRAILALIKANTAEGWKTVLSAMAPLAAAGRELPTMIEARNAFLNAAKLDQHHQLLETEAALLNGSSSLWAEGALLAISNRKNISPEAKTAVTNALDQGWNEPKRRVQILLAVAATAHRPYADRVTESLTDANDEVAKAAQSAASVLKLARKPKEKASEPLISTLKIEEVLRRVLKEKGDPTVGEQIFTRQGCVACHTVKTGDPLRGPFLGNIATVYKRPELAEAILLPNKSIAQGFATHHFQLKDESEMDGFVTQEAADKVTVRNVAGQEVVIPVKEIVKREKVERSIMPEELAAPLTVKEFASLLDYLEALAKK